MTQKDSPRYIMIGGFLGAGKSTALGQLARRLSDRGLRVGLITNDQASGLVDSATLRSQGFAVEEIAGGCFCCRFNSLVTAAKSLEESDKPDVFLAEPVGSCTDLVATVSYPLRRIYGDQFKIAPLSVLVDPARAARVLGLSEGRTFSKKVIYVYEKQLEEAELIVINKCDLLDEAARTELRNALEKRYPEAKVFEISAREGDGLEEWLTRVQTTEISPRESIEIDYDIYAEGEALLGWLNATIGLSAMSCEAGGGEVDGNEVLRDLTERIQAGLTAVGGEVAHLKMTLAPDDNTLGEIAVVNLVRQDYVPEVCQELPDPVAAGQVILNLRAECAPEELRAIVEREIAATSGKVKLVLEHVESFRPGRPTPTHRDRSHQDWAHGDVEPTWSAEGSEDA